MLYSKQQKILLAGLVGAAAAVVVVLVAEQEEDVPQLKEQINCVSNLTDTQKTSKYGKNYSHTLD